MKIVLSKKDLLIIHSSMAAYYKHLEPSSFVPSIAVWMNDVDQMKNKVMDIILSCGDSVTVDSGNTD